MDVLFLVVAFTAGALVAPAIDVYYRLKAVRKRRVRNKVTNDLARNGFEVVHHSTMERLRSNSWV